MFFQSNDGHLWIEKTARLLGRPGIAIRGAANVLRFHWRPSTSPERPEETAKRFFFFSENLVDLQMIWCGVTHGLILILKLLKIMIRMDFPWYSQSPGKIHDRFDWRKGNNCKNNMIPGSYPCLSFEIYWSKPGKFPITSGTCRTSWSGFLWGTESFR